ncbi:MAG: stage II sporulation protein P [Clostridia bacterium]|nr:stage II sporulation protein P [Clostridia bacterium]
MEKIRRKQYAVLLLLMFVLGVFVGLLLPKNSGFSPDPTAVAAFSASMADEGDGFSLVAVTDPPVATPPPGDGFTLEVIAQGEAEKKRILIYHTHTYEAYAQEADRPYAETSQWRTADPDCNMIRVGAELAGLLRSLGFEVVHDTTAFEPPNLDAAYTRSLSMLESRKNAGETYDLWIDLHRDAYVQGQSSSNTVPFGGQELARLMVLIGKGEGYTGQGYDEKPDWEKNLAYAQSITDELNRQIPGLCKDVLLKPGRFNQHVSLGCLLIEVGNNRNSLQEALRSMPYLADAIHQALLGE